MYLEMGAHILAPAQVHALQRACDLESKTSFSPAIL